MILNSVMRGKKGNIPSSIIIYLLVECFKELLDCLHDTWCSNFIREAYYNECQTTMENYLEKNREPFVDNAILEEIKVPKEQTINRANESFLSVGEWRTQDKASLDTEKIRESNFFKKNF